MKREQRAPYLKLAQDSGYIVCSFCRYGEYRGESDIIYCSHSLGDRFEEQGISAQELGDCWLFRPCYTLEKAKEDAEKWLVKEEKGKDVSDS